MAPLLIIKLFVFIPAFLFMPVHYSGATGNVDISAADTCAARNTFTESLAEYVQGSIIEPEQGSADDDQVWSSLVWIPTYYGYHTFLGVLDNFIAGHTSLTSLRTWRLEDRNFYVILLSRKNISIKIIYDSRNSLLMLTGPVEFQF